MPVWTNGELTGVSMANESTESKEQVNAVDEVTSSPPPPGPVEEEAGKAPEESTEQEEPAPDNDLNVIDDLLAAEDPEFAQMMSEIKEGETEAQAEAEVVIETLDIENLEKDGGTFLDRVERSVQFLISLPPTLWGVLKAGAKRSWAAGKEGFQKTVEFTKNQKAAYDSLPRRSKLMLWLAIFSGLFAVLAVAIGFSGSVTIDVGPKYLKSFADIADEKFVYDESEPLEDFTDPLFHPEHIVTMDRIMVNLRRPRNAPEGNPMGFFDFYLEASNQEGAVELKDREGEVRDLIGRTLEQLTYEELITLAGKEKMKLALRKNLNNFLTRGQVRRVYLKNIVLKE